MVKMDRKEKRILMKLKEHSKVSEDDWNKKRLSPRAKTIRKKFGSFREAREKAGLEPYAFPSALLKIASKLDLPRRVMRSALEIYEKARRARLFRKGSKKEFILASVYIACRKLVFPMTLRRMAKAGGFRIRTMNKYRRLIVKKLGLELEPLTPEDLVPIFCDRLKVGEKVKNKAAEIVREAQGTHGTGGRSPRGIAAGAVYIASIICGERRTQAEVGEIAGVTEVTIRNRYGELFKLESIRDHSRKPLENFLLRAEEKFKEIQNEKLK